MSLTCYKVLGVSGVLQGCYEETAPMEFRLITGLALQQSVHIIQFHTQTFYYVTSVSEFSQSIKPCSHRSSDLISSEPRPLSSSVQMRWDEWCERSFIAQPIFHPSLVSQKAHTHTHTHTHTVQMLRGARRRRDWRSLFVEQSEAAAAAAAMAVLAISCNCLGNFKNVHDDDDDNDVDGHSKTTDQPTEELMTMTTCCYRHRPTDWAAGKTRADGQTE